MKPTLSICDNGEYLFKNCYGVTWHIAKSYDALGLSQWNSDYKNTKIWSAKQVSTNPEYIQTGKYIKVPNFLKSIIFELNKKQ